MRATPGTARERHETMADDREKGQRVREYRREGNNPFGFGRQKLTFSDVGILSPPLQFGTADAYCQEIKRRER